MPRRETLICGADQEGVAGKTPWEPMTTVLALIDTSVQLSQDSIWCWLLRGLVGILLIDRSFSKRKNGIYSTFTGN